MDQEENTEQENFYCFRIFFFFSDYYELEEGKQPYKSHQNYQGNKAKATWEHLLMWGCSRTAAHRGQVFSHVSQTAGPPEVMKGPAQPCSNVTICQPEGDHILLLSDVYDLEIQNDKVLINPLSLDMI